MTCHWTISDDKKIPQSVKIMASVKQLEFPFQFEELDKAHLEAKRRVFGPNTSELNLVKTIPGGNFLPKAFQKHAQRIYNMEIRPDDIWVVTFPKCGTTWTQEIMWNMVFMDFDDDRDLFARSPFLEMDCIMQSQPPPPGSNEPPPEFLIDSIGYTERLASPRVIKTHLPFSMLPPKLLDTCKVIYISRNPLDACVSFFHHAKNGQHFFQLHGSFEDYANLYQNGQLVFGNYWDHLKMGWALRDHKNLKFMWYEDMQRDLLTALKELSTFTGSNRSDVELEQLRDHVEIKNMKQRSVDRAKNDQEKEFNSMFIRQGGSGGWGKYFKGSMLDQWMQWIADNTSGTDIKLQLN